MVLGRRRGIAHLASEVVREFSLMPWKSFVVSHTLLIPIDIFQSPIMRYVMTRHKIFAILFTSFMHNIIDLILTASHDHLTSRLCLCDEFGLQSEKMPTFDYMRYKASQTSDRERFTSESRAVDELRNVPHCVMLLRLYKIQSRDSKMILHLQSV